MGIKIIICGLNGAGKSTLGEALQKELGFHFIDNERLFFGEQNSDYTYASPRSLDEVNVMFDKEVQEHENFIFSAVKGDYGNKPHPLYTLAVLIEVPKEIRIRRIRERSYKKFGDRILQGGDLYEKEQAFFDMASKRPEDYVTNWLQTLNCPIIKVDGTKPIDINAKYIVEQVNLWK